MTGKSAGWLARRVHGPVMAQIFQHEVYFALADAAGLTPPRPDRLSCVEHYCEIGLDAGLPPHPAHRLDADDYRASLALLDINAPDGTAAGDLQRHWARIGLRAGAHASVSAWFRVVQGISLPAAIDANLQGLAAQITALPNNASRPRVAMHLAAQPKDALAALDMADCTTQGFLLDLADARHRAGATAQAEAICAAILSKAPDHQRAAVTLANILHRDPSKRIDEEIALRRNIPADFDAGATAVALAERLFLKHAYAEALTALQEAQTLVQGNVAMTHRLREVARHVFERVWGALPHHVARLDVAKVQDLLAHALALYMPLFDPVERTAPIRRVAIMASDDLYQCKLYRADQKIDQLRVVGIAADLFVQSRDIERLRNNLDRYDAVIFMRVPAFPAIVDLMSAVAAAGVVSFYDIDDLIFERSLFPPPLETYAGAISASQHDAIACGVPLFEHAMSLCSYGIGSTPVICDAMAPRMRSGRAFLHRNAIGKPHLAALRAAEALPPKPVGAKVRVFYGSGTRAHKKEFHDVLEAALADLLHARAGKVEIAIIGEFDGLKHLDPDHPDVTLLAPIWDFEAYCAELARADINLSILSQSPLTDAKSEIKWSEAALFAIPSVVSPTATLNEVIEDGKTGLICKDREEYVAELTRLVDDKALRQKIGVAAKRVIWARYALPAMGENLSDILEAVCSTTVPGQTRKPRLLVVNVFYPPQDVGGATRVVRDNVRDLRARHGDAFEIEVLSTLEGGTTPYEVTCEAQDGVRIWRVTAPPDADTMTITDTRMGDVMDRVIGQIAPDLVHLHCVQRLTASLVDVLRRRDIPYLVSLHDAWWISLHQFTLSPQGAPVLYDMRPETLPEGPQRARIAARALRDAAACLSVSEEFATLHRDLGVSNVRLCANGSDPVLGLLRVPSTDGRVRLAHLGGASRHKGFALVEAAFLARRFENLSLTVVDMALPPGAMREEVWNGTPVRFIPRRPLDAVGTLYGEIDVVLAPSIWSESFGLVAREALDAGLWVVASDRGAIGADVVEGKTGHILPVEDHHALVACLARIEAAPERYGAPTRASDRPVLRRPVAQADELAALYKSVLAKRY